MSQKTAPYQVSTQSSRNSTRFLSGVAEIISKKLNISSQAVIFQRLIASMQPELKILDGPTPQTKLIANFRQIYQVKDLTHREAVSIYFGLILINLDSPNLTFYNLIDYVSDKNNRVRDIAVHPNKKRLSIFYQDKIQFYKYRRQNDKYKIQIYDTVGYPTKMAVSDVRYTPSGEHIVGLSQDSLTSQLKLFKLSTKNSSSMLLGSNINNQCKLLIKRQYLMKWVLAIDKNEQNIVVIPGGFGTACVINITTLRTQTQNLQSIQNQQIIPRFNQTANNNSRSGGLIFSSAGFINSTSKGYYIFYQPYANNAQLYTINQTKMFYKNTFSFLPGQSKQNQGIAKCIDITDINSIACTKSEITKIYISKIDMANNMTYLLGTIKNPKLNVTNQTDSRMKQPIVQDMFYYSKTGQICYIYQQTLRCSKINTNCTTNSSLTTINKCTQVCKQNDPHSYWNPITMSCEKGITQCTQSKLSYDPYYGGCALDCSKIQTAVPYSRFSNNQKCICTPSFVWYPDLKTCRYNCSNIAQTDSSVDFKQLQPKQCKCVHGFKFLNIFNSYDEQIGICKAFCDNGKPIVIQDGKPICQCPSTAKWDYKTFSCKSQNKKVQSAGIPGWIPFLIVLIVVFAVSAIGICIYRRRKSKKQVQQVPPNSDRLENAKGSETDLRNVGSSLTKVCTICSNGYENVNCMGPCGHYYHFSCIKERLDQQNYLCPQCNNQFPNGLADMKLVQKQQQVFSIAQN